MDLLAYQAEAQRTKSPAFYGNAVSRRIFIERVYEAIAALRLLDEVKKALFYNKQFKGIAPGELELTSNALQLHNMAPTPQQGIDLIHAILGKATESGELLEAMMRSLANNGVPFDTVNFIEEVGDGFWYDAIGLEAIGSSFHYVADLNNRKLRNRYPNKFTENEAIDRNLAAERETLEAPAGSVHSQYPNPYD